MHHDCRLNTVRENVHSLENMESLYDLILLKVIYVIKMITILGIITSKYRHKLLLSDSVALAVDIMKVRRTVVPTTTYGSAHSAHCP